nr:MAG TPA: hypothetical protein [Caudoviricetes sp.]
MGKLSVDTSHLRSYFAGEHSKTGCSPLNTASHG